MTKELGKVNCERVVLLTWKKSERGSQREIKNRFLTLRKVASVGDQNQKQKLGRS